MRTWLSFIGVILITQSAWGLSPMEEVDVLQQELISYQTSIGKVKPVAFITYDSMEHAFEQNTFDTESNDIEVRRERLERTALHNAIYDRLVFIEHRQNTSDHDYIIVNTASHRLHLIGENKEIMQMQAIVGKPSTPTPEFNDIVSYVALSAPGNVKLPFTHHPDKNMHIYGTDDRTMFDGDVRQLSSGNIRVDNPLGLAARLMNRTVSSVKSRLGDTERKLLLREPVNVYTRSWPVYVDRTGAIQYSRSVYE